MQDQLRTIGRNRGKSGVLSFQEKSGLINWIIKMQRHGHPIIKVNAV